MKSLGMIIASATKYPKAVIPAKAGIQENTGCRIKSDMTNLAYLKTVKCLKRRMFVINEKTTRSTEIRSTCFDIEPERPQADRSGRPFQLHSGYHRQ